MLPVGVGERVLFLERAGPVDQLHQLDGDTAGIAQVKDRLAAGEPSVAVVFVRKHCHPRGWAPDPALARHLHQWAAANPKP